MDFVAFAVLINLLVLITASIRSSNSPTALSSP